MIVAYYLYVLNIDNQLYSNYSSPLQNVIISKNLLLLEVTLEKKKVMPTRKFETVEDFEKATENVEELIIDGFENPKERASDYQTQKEDYSGKKKTHTDIGLCMSDRNRYIHYLSNYYPGKNVDYGLLKIEFPPKKGWFKNKRVLLDLGFVGFEKDYDFMEVFIGHKKPRKSEKNPEPELTEIEKQCLPQSTPKSRGNLGGNKVVTRKRIFVEHAIGGMKIFRILKLTSFNSHPYDTSPRRMTSLEDFWGRCRRDA